MVEKTPPTPKNRFPPWRHSLPPPPIKHRKAWALGGGGVCWVVVPPQVLFTIYLGVFVKL